MEFCDKGVPGETTKPNPGPHAHLFSRPNAKPAHPPIRPDALAAALRAFEAKGGEVQGLPPGYADGAVVMSYGKLLRS
jgi:hypothetical protein